jgi:hypothetical protein
MLFETRYFLVRFATKDPGQLSKLRSLLYKAGENRLPSVITVHEVYKISLGGEEGKDIAKITADNFSG